MTNDLSKEIDDPSFSPWDKLPKGLKESNFGQVDDIAGKLEMVGCSIEKIPSGSKKEKPFVFTYDQLELLSEMEHGRWNVEKLFEGWKYAEEKDVNRKHSPYLVGWNDLTEKIKEWDREAIRAIPTILKKVGLRIRKL